MESEDKANVSDELNYLRSLIESLDSQLSVLVRGMDEIRKAYALLKDEQLVTSKDVRVSIGAGIFAKADVTPREMLFVPIGSELYIEEAPPRTVERLEQNVKELDASIQNIQERRYEVSNRYNAIVSMMRDQSTGGQGKVKG